MLNYLSRLLLKRFLPRLRCWCMSSLVVLSVPGRRKFLVNFRPLLDCLAPVGALECAMPRCCSLPILAVQSSSLLPSSSLLRTGSRAVAHAVVKPLTHAVVKPLDRARRGPRFLQSSNRASRACSLPASGTAGVPCRSCAPRGHPASPRRLSRASRPRGAAPATAGIRWRCRVRRAGTAQWECAGGGGRGVSDARGARWMGR